MARFNPLVAKTESPPIPEAQGWLARYKGDRGPAINLSQAVPGTPPHPDLQEWLAEAAQDTTSASYGPITGDLALREAYADDVMRVYGGTVRPTNIAITAGCNQAFVVTMMALAGHGDAVILPSPWYFNHKMTLDMLSIETRTLACRPERGFVPDPEEAAAMIDGRVRALVLVSPNNPTGAVYPPDVIAAFHALCEKRGIWLVLDETYRDFLPAAQARPHELLSGGSWSNLIQLYSFSKSYCIPGYRLGAITGSEALINEIAKIQDCVQICPARVGQRAVAKAIPALGAWRNANRDDILERAEALKAALRGANGWSIDSIGAYFAYVRHPLVGQSSKTAAERLAAEEGVLCLPSSFFANESDTHLRVAFGNVPKESLELLAPRFQRLSV